MDLTIVDVSRIPGVVVGDEVTLIGRDGKNSIEVEELARHYESIPYEVMCGISKRVPRRYIGS